MSVTVNVNKNASLYRVMSTKYLLPTISNDEGVASRHDRDLVCHRRLTLHAAIAVDLVPALVRKIIDLHLLLNSDGVFFFQAEDGIRDVAVTGVQTCALPI